MLLAKYGTAFAVSLPVIKAGTSDFATSADYTYAAGDIKVSIDGGAAANITNAPTWVSGMNALRISLTTAEMSGAQVLVTLVDAATKAVEDQALLVHTFGSATAHIEADLDVPRLSANMAAINGSTADLSAFARGVKGLITGAAITGSTATAVATDLTNATTDAYKGGVIVFTSGALAGQRKDITAYDGTTKTLTVTAFTSAPAAGDTFFIA